LVALPLTELGHEVIGVDLAPAMLVKAKARIGARVTVADAMRLPVHASSFDAAVAVWVLHVVGDRAATLAEIHRVLRPGAKLAVVPADAEIGGDDITDAHDDINLRLGLSPETPPVVTELAAGAGFTLDWLGHMDVLEFDDSPLQQAARIEARQWSALWNVDDDTWADVVQPLIDRLRALPEPDRPRHRTLAHHLLVFTRL
jgi:SAM-dependent methyltransferase